MVRGVDRVCGQWIGKYEGSVAAGQEKRWKGGSGKGEEFSVLLVV